MKSYFQELGFSYEVEKESGHEDLIVRRPHGADSLMFLTAKELQQARGDPNEQTQVTGEEQSEV